MISLFIYYGSSQIVQANQNKNFMFKIIEEFLKTKGIKYVVCITNLSSVPLDLKTSWKKQWDHQQKCKSISL